MNTEIEFVEDSNGNKCFISYFSSIERAQVKADTERHITDLCDLENVARAALIAEVGYTVLTDVDNYEFMAHDTRY